MKAYTYTSPPTATNFNVCYMAEVPLLDHYQATVGRLDLEGNVRQPGLLLHRSYLETAPAGGGPVCDGDGESVSSSSRHVQVEDRALRSGCHSLHLTSRYADITFQKAQEVKGANSRCNDPVAILPRRQLARQTGLALRCRDELAGLVIVDAAVPVCQKRSQVHLIFLPVLSQVKHRDIRPAVRSQRRCGVESGSAGWESGDDRVERMVRLCEGPVREGETRHDRLDHVP